MSDPSAVSENLGESSWSGVERREQEQKRAHNPSPRKHHSDTEPIWVGVYGLYGLYGLYGVYGVHGVCCM